VCLRRRDGHGLAQLLSELAQLDGLRWMRILYAYPSYFDDELIQEIARNPKVQKTCADGGGGGGGLAGSAVLCFPLGSTGDSQR
jgi:hypothetical protein